MLLSTDRDLRIGDDILIGIYPNVTFLNPGESYVRNEIIHIDRELSGTFYLFVVTDNNDATCSFSDPVCDSLSSRGYHDSDMAEISEQNNCKKFEPKLIFKKYKGFRHIYSTTTKKMTVE